jgi:uncharacterized UPF0160 family protein
MYYQVGLLILRKHISWKGVRDEKLDEVSGIEGCIFVHASGFTGGKSFCFTI